MSDQGDAAAKEILSLERAALDRWGRGDPSGFLELCAPGVTYFDPFVGVRLDGLDRLREYYETLRGKVHVARYELLNPSVLVRGDTAVLTFNYASFSAAELEEPDARWNCTEVYAREEDRWRIVQTHWSLTGVPGADS